MAEAATSFLHRQTAATPLPMRNNGAETALAVATAEHSRPPATRFPGRASPACPVSSPRSRACRSRRRLARCCVEKRTTTRACSAVVQRLLPCRMEMKSYDTVHGQHALGFADGSARDSDERNGEEQG